MGTGKRPPEGVIYRLGHAAAARRARASAIVASTTAIAPVLLGVVLLRRVGSMPTGPFWIVSAAIGALIAARAFVQYGATKRRLGALRVTLDDESILSETTSDGYAISRARVARIVEIEGALGGVRVESEPDPRSGIVLVASVPRGGDEFGEVRARLERWRPIERRGRRGPIVRVLIGVAVVATVFFLPFVLEDFVARSKFVAAGLVVCAWAATRWTMRSR